MKALNVLKSPIVEIGSDSDLNLHKNAVVLFATREQIKEAIEELEALQSRSCEGCVHLDRGRFCTLPASNHCIRDAEDYFEPKEQ